MNYNENALEYLKKNDWTEEDLNGYRREISILMQEYAEFYCKKKFNERLQSEKHSNNDGK